MKMRGPSFKDSTRRVSERVWAFVSPGPFTRTALD